MKSPKETKHQFVMTVAHFPIEFQTYKSATQGCLIVAIGLEHKKLFLAILCRNNKKGFNQ